MERRSGVGRRIYEGTQRPRPFPMPWLRVANHAGDYVFPSAVKHLQHVRVGRVRIIVEELDPPVALPTHLPGSMQDDALEHLAAVHGLDCPDQAVAALSIA